MTPKEKIAIDNDTRELVQMINPAHVKVWRLPAQDGYSQRLRLDVTGIRTWVITKANSTPHLSDSISIYVDCPNGYPNKKIHIYYGSEKWPAHVNVFTGHEHTQCIDSWTKYSSIASAVRKTLLAVAFDPAVAKFDSMANSTLKPFMDRNRSSFPSTDPRLLFRPDTARSMRTPKSHT